MKIELLRGREQLAECNVAGNGLKDIVFIKWKLPDSQGHVRDTMSGAQERNTVVIN